jgi:S-DNA-T family DNA segregation ATPase FtsK/SpoIIIE
MLAPPSDKPVSLGSLDPELQTLLAQRQALLASLRDPIRLAQARLAEVASAGVSVAPQEHPPAGSTIHQLGTTLAEGLHSLRQVGQEIESLEKQQPEANRRKGLDTLAGVEARLRSLSQEALAEEELASLAPELSDAWRATTGRIAELTSRINELERGLSGWWGRFVDWLREQFSDSSHREAIAEAGQELKTLTAKGKRQEEKTRRQALAVLRKRRAELSAQEKQRNEQLADLQNRREAIVVGLRRDGGRMRHALRAFCDDLCQELQANAGRIHARLRELPPAAVLPWDAQEWDGWPAPGEDGKVRLVPFLSPYLRVGEVRELTGAVLTSVADGEALDWLLARVQPIRLPVVAPFIGAGKSLVVACDQQTRASGLAAVQAMILRIAALLGRQGLFTLLDPGGHGQAFPLQRFLRTRPNAEDVNAELRGVLQDIRRVNQEVLTTEAGLHELKAERLRSESFEVVVAADFPKGYDRRAIETLFNVAASGPRAGRYVVLHYNREHQMPRESPIEGVNNRVVLDPERLFDPGPSFDFVPDELPGADGQQQLLERINNAGRIDYSLAWHDLVGLPEARWWTLKSGTDIGTPIGVRGATDLVEIWFGARQQTTCAHGMLAATTGAGKSTLYHGLILGLAVRYPPDELQMYLIDGKFGVEFRPYEHLPHAAVVSLKSQPELSRSVLQEVFREMERRNALFVQEQVEDYTRYRSKPCSKQLPRILVLIDEYQELFEDDPTTASDLLRRLAQQGRSAGIHLFLGAQKFGAPGMLHQADIFNNIHLRVALKMQPDAIAGLTEFGPKGRRMISDCDIAGKFVLNVTGKDENTVSGQAANLEPEQRPPLIAALRKKAGAGIKPPVVFKGDAAPDVFDNVALKEVLRHRAALTPKQLEARARTEAGPAGGFGQPAWVAADRPVGLWLGRLFNVHGHAMALLRRGVSQHLVIVGTSAEARAGMLAGVVVSVAALCRPGELALSILHAGADEEDPTVQVLQRLADGLLRPCGFDVSLGRDPALIEPLLAQLDCDLSQRRERGAREVPSRLVVLLDPDRMHPLRRAGDWLSRPPNANYDKLRRLLAEGSQHGTHVILVGAALRLLAQVIDDRRDLAYFSHRAALQMSEDDSFALFRSRKAAQLQVEGAPLPCALYSNVETSYTVRFKAYAPVADSGMVGRVAQHLKKEFAKGQAGG